MTCFDCGYRLEHCHGTLVRHSREIAECTDPECVLPELVCHALVVDCVEVSCAHCAAQETRAVAA